MTTFNSDKTKKAYKDIVDLLIEKKSQKIETVLPKILQMTEQKNNLKTHLLHQGKVIAIFCYYHKQWELLSDVEYGKKASSATGYNTMCKLGVSKWTKQNNAVKKVNATILEMLEAGKLETKDIADVKTKLIEQAKVIDTTDMPKGYDTAEDVPMPKQVEKK